MYTVKCGARSVATGASAERSSGPPLSTISAGPWPLLSYAMVVPSFEVTVCMASLWWCSDPDRTAAGHATLPVEPAPSKAGCRQVPAGIANRSPVRGRGARSACAVRLLSLVWTGSRRRPAGSRKGVAVDERSRGDRRRRRQARAGDAAEGVAQAGAADPGAAGRPLRGERAHRPQARGGPGAPPPRPVAATAGRRAGADRAGAGGAEHRPAGRPGRPPSGAGHAAMAAPDGRARLHRPGGAAGAARRPAARRHRTSPATVVITAIAGTAGVGKTALAVHWAHQVRERFPDGQLYVNLHGYAPGTPLGPLAALAQMLGALGVAADGVPLQLDQAAGLYRSLLAGKRVLVVLDNARSAAQVRPLLPGSPGCLVLITSRDRLDGLVASHGADRLALDVLTPAEAVSLLGRIMGAPRVAAAAGTDDLRAQSAGHRSLAMARSCLGDYAQAADHHGSALELARQAGCHLTQALARYRQTGSKLGEAVTLVNLAGVTRELGWPQRAAGHAGEALAVSREIGSQGGEIAALSTLGETDRDLGRLDDARRHLSQSLALTREL